MKGTYTKNSQFPELYDNNICEAVKSLCDSILEIDSSYLHYANVGYGAKQDSIIEHVERVFAYELYKQWKENNFVNKNELKVNAEISKSFYSSFEDKKIKICYPDMVLHGGQETSRNLIVCEIKRLENLKSHLNAQTKDLNRLGYFLTPNLKVKKSIEEWKEYKCGVFLLIGYESELKNQEVAINILKEHIHHPKYNVQESLRSKIICMAYNGDCKNIYFATLDEL